MPTLQSTVPLHHSEKHAFKQDDVYRVSHVSGRMLRIHAFVDLPAFHSRVYESTRKGEKQKCCGCAMDLKELTIGVSQGIEKIEVGTNS